MKTRNEGSFLGLTPMLLFVSLVVITGLLANDFGAMPILVAFMISAGYALTLNPSEQKLTVGQKVDIFCTGGGEKTQYSQGHTNRRSYGSDVVLLRR